MIQSLEDLSQFLHRWYGQDKDALADPDWNCTLSVATPLSKSWDLFGRLFLGNDDWFRSGTGSPLACQDGLTSPDNVKHINDIIMVASENQGNWIAGYKAEDSNQTDPEIYSSWLNDWEDTGQDYMRIGASLSQFIITISLTETVFFSSNQLNESDEASRLCNIILWEGRYYNAEGMDGRYEKPSHKIRTNEAQTMLCFDSEGTFSGFAGHSEVGGKRWLALKARLGEN